jgi:hypothetical protein
MDKLEQNMYDYDLKHMTKSEKRNMKLFRGGLGLAALGGAAYVARKAWKKSKGQTVII